MKIKKNEIKNYGLVIVGGIIFAAGLNLFIVPVGLYSGGIIGIAQIIRTMLQDYTSINLPQSVDMAGIINFIMNIPLFILAYRSISKTFFTKTLLCVIAQTLSMTLITIPSVAILDDTLAACLIGGLICGFGIGLALRSGGSGGGLDILGVFFTKKFANFSVGKLGIIVNVFVFGVCAWLFNIEIAIYSIIYTACMLMVLDKIHYQNINMTAMIFTKNEHIKEKILRETGRGVTYWIGAGAYTKSDTQILMTVISKYEIGLLKKIIYETDPQAFVIFTEGSDISGNFEKRL